MFNLNIHTMHQIWKENSEHTIFTLIQNQKSHAAISVKYISRVK